MEEAPLKGSCLCGAVRYELGAAPVWAHACHCSRCRKATGSAFASNLFVPLDALRFTQGEAHLRAFQPPDAERFVHRFCAICASPLPSLNPARGNVVVPMGSLDDDPGLSPQAHIWVASRADWDAISDDLPQHPEALGSGD